MIGAQREFSTGGQEFDRFYTFDSSLGDSINFVLDGEKNWIASIVHVRFAVDGGYPDKVAYLHIESNSLVSTSTTTQKPKISLKGAILPIILPDVEQSSQVGSYIKGRYTGPDQIKFAILDKELKPVQTTRLIVYMHMTNHPSAAVSPLVSSDFIKL